MADAEKVERRVEAPGFQWNADGRARIVQIVLRVLMGIAGLTLLVGFFLPWFHFGPDLPANFAIPALRPLSGFDLALRPDLAGTPSGMLWLIPGLGVALAIAAFMGFRYAPQLAVAIGTWCIGYSIYVLLKSFWQHTGAGLWVVAGGVFLVLVFGIAAWLSARHHGQRAGHAKREPKIQDPKALESEV